MDLPPTQLKGIEQFLDIEKLLTDSKDKSPVDALKCALQESERRMHLAFETGTDIRLLVYGRAWVIDQILRFAWQQFDWPDLEQIALVAVGGYGRGELHPKSDIDLLILMGNIKAEVFESSISGFLTLLWDISLDIGSSVRNIDECYEEARNDITIATNLIESRTLIGNNNLRETMFERVTSDEAWSDSEFFKAKLQEQSDRHSRTNNTEYNLERLAGGLGPPAATPLRSPAYFGRKFWLHR